ncbi:MAG: PhoH family protein [Thermoprotei archaeon]|nr:MAG: PhoH family protein [Thermoprotei archaeon]
MSLPGNVKPLTENQKKMIAALESKDADVVGVFGPSGTGKSFITCLYGIKAIKEDKYSRFVIIRPVIELNTGKRYSSVELGNTYYEMASAYLYDILSLHVNVSELKNLLAEKKIMLADPNFLSGRTFDNSLVFLDDAQFLPERCVSESLIRIGRDSKLVIAGDPVFQLAEENRNTAVLARELILGEERAIVVDLGIKDIVRPGAKRGFKLSLEMRLRKRELNEEEKKILNTAYVHAPDAEIITVFYVKDLKERYKLNKVPDALIISKEGYLGRLIGKNGERINKMQDEIGLFLRSVELTEDLSSIVVALHPLGWIEKHILDLDIVGPNLEIEVNSREFGPFVGQKGVHVRFLDECLRGLLGIGIRARPGEVKTKRKTRKK